MEFKYKVGDKVIIKSGLRKINRKLQEAGVSTGGLSPFMTKLEGKTLTISKQQMEGYRLKEEHEEHYWVEQFLLPVDEDSLFDELIRGSITKVDYETHLDYVKGRVDK